MSSNRYYDRSELRERVFTTWRNAIKVYLYLHRYIILISYFKPWSILDETMIR